MPKEKRFRRLRIGLRRIKRPLRHIKKVKHVRWLLPGWVFYEYYKVHKNKGHSRRKSFGHGAKAEVVRLAAFASLPVPGTYELTTTGLAVIKKKIENDELDKFTLRSFKDFIPLRKLRVNKHQLIGQPYLKVYSKDRRLYFEIFYKKKNQEQLFVYGTLKNPKIQKEVIGKVIRGTTDVLIGYEKKEILIDGEIYPVIVENNISSVKGLVIIVTKKELKRIDKYEGINYKRKNAILRNGNSVWAYTKR